MFGLLVFAKFIELDNDNMFEWRAIVANEDRRTYQVTYRAGLAHSRRVTDYREGATHDPKGRGGWLLPTEPKARDILESLQVDCRSADHDTFEDFADEFGYDSDSRKAEAIYNACRKTRSEMRKLLGAEFDAFMSFDFDSET